MANTSYAVGTAKAWNRDGGAGGRNSMGAVAVQESESLNDSFGFERDLWQRKTGQSSHVPKTSIRLDQAPFITQIRSALMRVLASSMSFRISAVMATFGGFPALIKA